MAKRWTERLTDYENGLKRLSEAIEDQKKFKIESLKDAVIQRFEFTLEMAWKSLKYYLESEGIVDVNTPKQIIREGFSRGILTDGDIWIDMLDDRNLTSHTYSKETADIIFKNITDIYCDNMWKLYNLLVTKKVE